MGKLYLELKCAGYSQCFVIMEVFILVILFSSNESMSLNLATINVLLLSLVMMTVE